MTISDILGYRSGRNLSKILLIFIAIAISTFASEPFINQILSFNLFAFIQTKDILAILSLLLILFINDDILNIPNILINEKISKYLYYLTIILIGIYISSLTYLDFLTKYLDYEVFGYNLSAVRNIIAIILLWIVKIIHTNG